jgi:hypothetical protein
MGNDKVTKWFSSRGAADYTNREWLDARQAADYTNLGFSTLAKGRLTGDTAPFTKVGTKVLYRRADLDRWLESKRVRNTSQVA